MANLTTYTRNALVNWQRGGSSMASATTRYLALFNGDPTSGGTDITSTICTNRLALSGMSTSSGSARSSTNGSTLTFTSSAGGSGTLTYIAAYDASTSGNMIWYKSVTSRSIVAGNGLSIAASDLTITAGTNISGYAGDQFVNWLTGVASMSATTTRYLALFNDSTEVTTNIRAAGRVAVTSALPAASGGSTTSNADISFGAAAHGNTVTHLAIFDASSAGNQITSSAVTGGGQTIITGYTVYIPSGSLTIAAN